MCYVIVCYRISKRERVYTTPEHMYVNNARRHGDGEIYNYKIRN